MSTPDPPLPPYPYPGPPPRLPDGAVVTPPGQTLGPPVYPHRPDMVESPPGSHVWVPDPRPLAPGSTVPAANHEDEEPPGRKGGDGEKLDVDPVDLHKAGDDYAELAARAATISPQAVDEVNRIIATHGVMGYPAAVGIVAGLAAREAKVNAKAAQFGDYAQRFTDHALTYLGEDAAGAARIGEIGVKST